MLLDDLLERNRGFVRGRESRPLPEPGTIRAAFVACYDPRLDNLIRPALGLADGEGFLIRTAGARVAPDGDPLRSLTLAVYLFAVTEIYVIAHTSCRMRTFATASFIDAFRARGVARDAFGAGDLREWAGAFSDFKSTVGESLRALAAAPMIPADLMLGGLMLDDTSGALEVLVPAVSAATLRAVPSMGSAPAVRTTPAVSPPDAVPAAPPRAAEVPPAVAASSPTPLSKEVDAIRGFVRTLETTSGWREDLARLRQELDRQRSPLARLTLVEKFVRRSAANARGVAAAFEQLRKESVSARASLSTEELVDLFRRIGQAG